MRIPWLVSTVFALYTVLCPGQETPSSALLGAPEFRPTPENPVGWRGDWMGRYPGAKPALTWSRRVKGLTSSIRYQARKPNGEPGAESRPLEYFALKDWLVAGPFDAPDPKADIDKDFLGGEAEVQPDEGTKAGGQTWKFVRTSMETQSHHAHNEGICRNLNVDFVFCFGTFSQKDGGNVKLEGDFANKAAYAHTYFHSPAEGSAHLVLHRWGAATRAWLNGQAVPLTAAKSGNGSPVVQISKGWNRLLVKVTSAEGIKPEGQNAWVSKWRFAAYLTPAGPVAYETKNIQWMTKLTGKSMSQPIVVGDRIFLGSGDTDLLCLGKTDGKMRWIRTNTPYEALSAEERKEDPALQEKVEPLLAKLSKFNEDLARAINADDAGLTPEQRLELDKLLKERRATESAIHKAFETKDRARFPNMFGNEVTSSNATPCSDGLRVYSAWGGGMKGPGASVIACFDPDGNRLWTHHEALGATEHGVHTSPLLLGGNLVYAANRTLVALDALTGKVAWKVKDPQYSFCGTSPLPARVGASHMVLVQPGHAIRAADGVVLAKTTLLNNHGDLTAIVDGGTLYQPVVVPWGAGRGAHFHALKLGGNGSPLALAWKLPHEEVDLPMRSVGGGGHYFIASPLFASGLVYSVTTGGGLIVVDTSARKCALRKWLDGYTRYDRFVFGVCASPTLGGRHVFVVDDSGHTLVLEPGGEYKEAGRNVIENIQSASAGMYGLPCQQECFYTSPVFEGGRMYLRGEEYLYCIGEK